MIGVALVALLACDTWTESSVHRALLFLARHQNDDGSWGRSPECCVCRFRPREMPIGIPRDAETERKFRELARGFESDEIAVRARAQQDIVKLGASVAPLLFETHYSDPEVQARCHDTLQRLWESDARTRELWTGARSLDFEVHATALAVLCFLGAGYTQLSRDEYCDVSTQRTFRLGEVVKKALKWLLARQNEEGAFAPRHPISNAIAALAMSEAFGMTAAELLREPAFRGIAFVTRAEFEDSAFLLWKGLALHSARRSDIPLPAEATLSRLVGLLEKDASPAAVTGSVLLSLLGRSTTTQLGEFHLLSRDALSSEELSLYSMAARTVWEPKDPRWSLWSDATRSHLNATQVQGDDCLRGSWEPSVRNSTEARLLSTIHSTDTLLRHYRYASVFGEKGP